MMVVVDCSLLIFPSVQVAMSVAKLMSRIVAPDMEGNESQSKARAHKLHDYTYGITSDPLTQFACVFSALIHDVVRFLLLQVL